MAKELAHFQNFAKLKDTKVAFNDITVIAGKPGTGKSYVMKMMYAIDVSNISYEMKIDILTPMLDGLKKRKEELDKLSKDDSDYINKQQIFDTKLKSAQNMLSEVKEFSSSTSAKKINRLSNLLKSIFMDINQLSTIFDFEYRANVIGYKENNFLGNLEEGTAQGNVIFVETPLILEFKKFMKREEGKTRKIVCLHICNIKLFMFCFSGNSFSDISA